MASEPTRERFEQRTDPQGVRLVRTGMEEGVVLADIANAIRHHDLTLSELRAILDEGHPPASPVPSVEALLAQLEDEIDWHFTNHGDPNVDTSDDYRNMRESLALLRSALRSEAEPSEDAKRLDWLDDQAHLCQKPEFWMMGDEYSVEMCGECWTGKTLRDAIDSARSSSPEPDPNGT